MSMRPILPCSRRAAPSSALLAGPVVSAGPEPAAGAEPGDEHGRPVRADGHRTGDVGPVAGAVVAADPPPRAGGGAVGDRGVVRARGGAGAQPGDEHAAPARADGQRTGDVDPVLGAVVAADPPPAAGGGVVG